MKAFLCLFVLAAGANAEFLGSLIGGYGGSYGGGYGGGLGGQGGHEEIIKIIHEDASGPVGLYENHHQHNIQPQLFEPAQQIVTVIEEHGQGLHSGPGFVAEEHHHVEPVQEIIKVIHEDHSGPGLIAGGHHHIEAAPQILKVIHEDHSHGGAGLSYGRALSYGGDYHHAGPAISYAGGYHQNYVEAVPQIVQIVHEEHGHGHNQGYAQGFTQYSAPAPVVQVINEQETHHSLGGGYHYGRGISSVPAQQVQVVKLIQDDISHHHHGGHHHSSYAPYHKSH